jgi:hypothetical protein
MMRVVGLRHDVRDGQLQLIQPEPFDLTAGRQPESRPQKLQDICGLRDKNISRLQERRRERRPGQFAVAKDSDKFVDAAVTRHIPVLRSRILKRKAHKFTSTLDVRPVKQFIPHSHAPFSERRTRMMRTSNVRNA